MELMYTPMEATSNQNENLIQSGQNRQLNTNVNQYFVVSDDQSCKEYNTFIIEFDCFDSNVLKFSILILFFLGGTIPVELIMLKLEIYLIIAIKLYGVIIILILFIFGIKN